VRYESIECAGRHTCKCCCGHYRRSNETNPMNSFTSFHTSGAGVHVSIHCSSPDCRDLALSCIIASRSGARREVPGDKGGDTVPAASAKESADMSNDELVSEVADQFAALLKVAVDEDGAGTGTGTDTSGEASVAVGRGPRAVEGPPTDGRLPGLSGPSALSIMG